MLRRDRWLNLNGLWDFAADPDGVGVSERWQNRTEWPSAITVPFAPNSAASGCTVDPMCKGFGITEVLTTRIGRAKRSYSILGPVILLPLYL